MKSNSGPILLWGTCLTEVGEAFAALTRRACSADLYDDGDAKAGAVRARRRGPGGPARPRRPGGLGDR